VAAQYDFIPEGEKTWNFGDSSRLCCAILDLGNAPQEASAMTGAEETVEILAVCAADEDFVSLEHIFSHSNWHLGRVCSCGAALDRMRRQPPPVIICSLHLPDGTWREVLAEAARAACPSRVIVAAHASDEGLWAEVLDLGAYDLFSKPFEPNEVIRVVSLAWRQWRHDRDARGTTRS
jgi:DNA-binding response OmpR family regulator